MNIEIKKAGNAGTGRDPVELAKTVLAITVIVALMVVAIAIAHRTGYLDLGISRSVEKWGQLGDFLGGSLNPIIGMATIILLFINLLAQRAELRETSKALQVANEHASLQAFEQSFYSLLATFRELLGSIEADVVISQRIDPSAAARDKAPFLDEMGDAPEFETITTSYQGRALFKALYAKELQSEGQNQNLLRPMMGDYAGRILNQYGGKFQFIARDYQYVLDIYFNTFYELFDLIDKYPGFSPEQRWKYAAIAKAQISWHELVFHFCNGLLSDNFRFVHYYEKYALFANIKNGRDILLELVAYGYTTGSKHNPIPYSGRAFSLLLAQRALGIAVDPPKEPARQFRKLLTATPYDLTNQWGTPGEGKMQIRPPKASDD